MQTPLLQTKLYIPQSHPGATNLILRSRLMERLDQGLSNKLALISAPPGFGKTTLVSEWAGRAKMPVAWLSLEEADNDLARFLCYVVAALQTCYAPLGETVAAMLQSPQPPPLESLLILQRDFTRPCHSERPTGAKNPLKLSLQAMI